MKVTIDLDADLYRSLKVEAARADRSVRDVMADALASGWSGARTRRIERRRPKPWPSTSGTAARRRPSYFEKLAAETKAEYGSGR